MSSLKLPDKCLRGSLLAALLLALCTVAVPARAQTRTYDTGDLLPDQTFETVSRWPQRRIKLSDFAGKTIVLVFMMHGHGPCHAFAPKLEREIWQGYKKRNTKVIGVLMKSSNAKRFASTHGLSFPVCVDRGHAKLFRRDGFPFIVVLDGQRRIIATTRGVAAKDMIATLKRALP